MFGKEQLGFFLPLAHFANIRDLQICGGDFYSDKLIDLLEQIGRRINSLQSQTLLKVKGWRSWIFMQWVSST